MNKNPFTTEMALLIEKFKEKNKGKSSDKNDILAEVFNQYSYITEGMFKIKELLTVSDTENIETSDFKTFNTTEKKSYQERIKTLENTTKNIENDVKEIDQKNLNVFKTIQKAFNEDLNIQLKLDGLDSGPINSSKKNIVSPTRKGGQSKLLEASGKSMIDRIRTVEETLEVMADQMREYAKKDDMDDVKNNMEILKFGSTQKTEQICRNIVTEYMEKSESVLAGKINALENSLKEKEKLLSEKIEEILSEFNAHLKESKVCHDKLLKEIEVINKNLAKCVLEKEFNEAKNEILLRINNTSDSMSKEMNEICEFTKNSIKLMDNRVNDYEKNIHEQQQMFRTMDATDNTNLLKPGEEGVKLDTSVSNDQQNILKLHQNSSLNAEKATLAKHDLLLNDLNLRLNTIEEGAQRLEPNNIKNLIMSIADLVLRNERKEVESAFDTIKGKQKQYGDVVDVLKEELIKLNEKFKQDIDKKISRKDLSIAKNQIRRKVLFYACNWLID